MKESYNKKLKDLRNQIDSADKALYEALHSRLQVVTKIADLKKEYGILEMSKPRQTEILEKLSYHKNIPNSLIFKLYNIIFEYSIKKQESIINKK
jgi:chorismate mutase